MLPRDYLIGLSDMRMIDHASKFWNGFRKNAAIVDAFKMAVKDGCENIDPYELLIDADICDTRLNAK